jgi:hypothetical protein
MAQVMSRQGKHQQTGDVLRAVRKGYRSGGAVLDVARRVCHGGTHGVKKAAKKLAKTLDKLSRLWYTKAIKRKEITTMTTIIITLACDRLVLAQVLLATCVLTFIAFGVLAIVTTGIVW